jgi:hypothetical protein
MTPDEIKNDPFNFDDIPLPGDVSAGETLEAMLAEGREITSRGKTFVAVPPTIRELERIFPLLNRMQETSSTGDTRGTMAASAQLARRMLRVRKENGDLRCATEEEISAHFTLARLSGVIRDLIADQGFGTDDEKN